MSSRNFCAISREEAMISSGRTVSMCCDCGDGGDDRVIVLVAKVSEGCSAEGGGASGNCFLHVDANRHVSESKITTANASVGAGRLARERRPWTMVGDGVTSEQEDGMRLERWMEEPANWLVIGNVERQLIDSPRSLDSSSLPNADSSAWVKGLAA